MCMRNKLIYDFMEHGLYYEPMKSNISDKTICLAIDTLQLEYDCFLGKIVGVAGYLPLIKARKKPVEILPCVEEDFSIKIDNLKIIKGIAYDFFKFFPKSKVYFLNGGLPVITYDSENKRILIGKEGNRKKNFQVTKNIICSTDEDGNLSAILLVLDRVILRQEDG